MLDSDGLLPSFQEVEHKAWAIAADIFRLRIDGERRAFSQFGIPYWMWGNGFTIQEGAVVPANGNVNRLLELYHQELARQREAYDVLVWRTQPMLLVRENGSHVLRVRWHFMNKEQL